MRNMAYEWRNITMALSRDIFARFRTCFNRVFRLPLKQLRYIQSLQAPPKKRSQSTSPRQSFQLLLACACLGCQIMREQSDILVRHFAGIRGHRVLGYDGEFLQIGLLERLELTGSLDNLDTECILIKQLPLHSLPILSHKPNRPVLRRYFFARRNQRGANLFHTLPRAYI